MSVMLNCEVVIAILIGVAMAMCHRIQGIRDAYITLLILLLEGSDSCQISTKKINKFMRQCEL